MSLKAICHKAFEVAKVLYRDMKHCDLFKYASSMAYVTLFSLVPSLAVIFALVAVFSPFSGGNTPVVLKVKSLVLKHLTPGAGEQVISYLDQFLANLEIGKIGVTGFLGIVASLTLLLRQIELAMNNVFDVREERNFITRIIYFWTLLTLGTFLASIGLGILSGFSATNLTNWSGIKPLYTLAAKLFSIGGFFVVFAAIYKLVPNCQVRWKNAICGALVATALFFVASEGYGFFIARFSNYTVIYGALAAVPVFLLWLYLLWLIVLFGSVVTYRLELGIALRQDEPRRRPTPEERLHASLMRVALPALTLKILYEEFATGEGPADINYLVRHTGASESALRDALDLLKKADWIQVSRESEDAIPRYLPAKPAAKVRLGALADSLDLTVKEPGVSCRWFEVIAGKATNETTFADVLQNEEVKILRR